MNGQPITRAEATRRGLTINDHTTPPTAYRGETFAPDIFHPLYVGQLVPCPRDTNGDGDCGDRYCVYCAETVEAIERRYLEGVYSFNGQETRTARDIRLLLDLVRGHRTMDHSMRTVDV